MQVDNQDALFKWLVEELSPITDADPNALAKYVLALVKKPDKSPQELKASTVDQLNVFLADHTSPFVEKVFAAIANKSYLPAESPSSSSSAPASSTEKKPESISKPAETNGAVQKATVSSSSGSSKNDSSRPARKRISPPPTDSKEKSKNERRRSRSPRDRRGRQTTTRSGRASSSDRDRYSRRRSRSRSRSYSGSRSPPSYRSRSRRRCKDFEERGYCIRGEQCPYYHGPDPVVVDENALSTMVPMSTTGNVNFSLPPPGYNPHNPPPPGVVVSAGEYNPETPALTTNYSVPPPPIHHQWQQQPPPPPPPQQAIPQSAQYVPQPVAGYSQPPPAGAPAFRGGMRGRGIVRGRGGGVGRGGFGGPINRDNCTLQVAKIPAELNNIAKLNEHFAAFGAIENIQVRYNGDIESALVTFGSKYDAQKAYKSPAPVLNNRFIKVFWHKPEGQQDGVAQPTDSNGKPQAPASPPKPAEKPKIATVKESKFVSVEIQNHRQQIIDAKTRLARERGQLSAMVQAQNEHNIVLDKWMRKQKDLLAKARGSADEAERKNATKLVKHLHKKIREVKDEIDRILLNISEKSMLVDEFVAQIEELKKPQKKVEEGTRKRKAGSDAEEPESKLSSVVLVKGVKEDLVTELMAHMEQFGEVFDHSVKVDDGLATAVFPYKNHADAQKAISEGKVLNGETLDMELKTERIEEIPLTDTNMSADQLLAAIPSSLESDDEEDVLND